MLARGLIILCLVDIVMTVFQFLTFDAYHTIFEVPALDPSNQSSSLFGQGHRVWFTVYQVIIILFEAMCIHLLFWC